MLTFEIDLAGKPLLNSLRDPVEAVETQSDRYYCQMMFSAPGGFSLVLIAHNSHLIRLQYLPKASGYYTLHMVQSDKIGLPEWLEDFASEITRGCCNRGTTVDVDDALMAKYNILVKHELSEVTQKDSNADE